MILLIIIELGIIAAFLCGFFCAYFVLSGKKVSDVLPSINIPKIEFVSEKKAKKLDAEDEKKNEFFD